MYSRLQQCKDSVADIGDHVAHDGGTGVEATRQETARAGHERASTLQRTLLEQPSYILRLLGQSRDVLCFLGFDRMLL